MEGFMTISGSEMPGLVQPGTEALKSSNPKVMVVARNGVLHVVCQPPAASLDGD